MSLVALAIVVACMAMGVFHYWQREASLRDDSRSSREFALWAIKGLVLPILIWTFFNCGLVMSPLIPMIAQAQGAGKWAGTFIPVTAGIVFVVGSWWAAVTLAWISGRTFLRVEHRGEFLGTAGIWLIGGIPVAILIMIATNGVGAGLALALCFGVIAHSTLPLVPPKLAPTYSKAIAKIAFDKFNEAEWEIIQQLERQQTDFDGWMLLADLYATHFHDLPSAERTVCELCDDPATTPPQVAMAMNRLADWHLKLDNSPEHARWALEKILERLPDTHMARMAQARLNHLPATREQWLQERNGRTIKLKTGTAPPLPPPGTADPGSPAPVRTVPLAAPPAAANPVIAAKEQATEFVEQLTRNPDDVETREKFARLLAESLDKPGLGIDQLELLLRIPGRSEEQQTGWLSLAAEWHLRLRHDAAAARAVLERILAQFPKSRAAFDAQRRLYVLDIESKVRQRRKSLG